MINYINEVKKNLVNAKDQLSSLVNMLDESIVINNKTFQKDKINNVVRDINIQINNLTYDIIPAVKRM